MTSEFVSEELSKRSKEIGPSKIVFHEVFPSASGTGEDYNVVYEGVLEPKALTKVRVEVWVTDVGRTAIGLETRMRISKRLGLRNWRRGFAAGHEPRALSPQSLRAFLNAAAEGKFMFKVSTVLGVLGKIQAGMLAEDRRTLETEGYGALDWVDIFQNGPESNVSNLSLFSTQLIGSAPWNLEDAG
jgi:hypothetical protein